MRPEFYQEPDILTPAPDDCKPEPTMIPPLALLLFFADDMFILGITFPPMIGWRLGRKAYFLGRVSARWIIDNICSDESIGALFFESLEAVVDRVVFEALPWPILVAAL